MAPLGLDFAKTDIAAVFFQGRNNVPGLISGVEPVRTEGDHQKRYLGQGRVDEQVAAFAHQVKVICRLGDVEQGVGVKAVDKLFALVMQVALHLKITAEVEGQAAAV